uniref:Ras association domain family member 9 n=1 Tax=Lepisosteus oculatus TaxID=7918 RepID=W5NHS0_LEPOC|nr:PREDICTED: ras association domain-containing protein 9 [Lepisosteus oculatus]
MAPFGRNFLKARLKNRSASKDTVSGKNEIQVWVCQEEKVVSGLTKHTTCADVVQALLEDHESAAGDKRTLPGDSRDYCLLEKWKGFERALPPLTRIWRLWKAWGDEQTYLQFILVKADDFMPHSGWRTSDSKGMPANQKRWDRGPAQYVKSLPVDKQQRMVRKAFRKLEKMRKETTRKDQERMETLVQLIISQDLTIRHQIQRMRELDIEIEKTELELSFDKGTTEEEGCAEDALLSNFSLKTESQPTENPSQDNLYISNGIGQLEEQLQNHADLINKLSSDIEEEIRSIWFQDTEELERATTSTGLDLKDEETASVLESMRVDLESSMCKGLSINMQLTEIQKELRQNDFLLHSKNEECENLEAHFSSLHVAENVEYICSVDLKSQTRTSTVKNKFSQKLSKTDMTDTDSDTGISSTHSQDSLSPSGEVMLPS